MSKNDIFRFLDLPPEIRVRIYVNFLDLVSKNPISVFDLAGYPAIIDKLTGPIREEMLHVFYSENRFSISSQLGLRSLLSTKGSYGISKLQHLRLEKLISHSNPWRYPVAIPVVTVNVDVVNRSPWFSVRTISESISRAQVGEVQSYMTGAVEALIPTTQHGLFAFDATSIEALVQAWLRCCRDVIGQVRLGKYGDKSDSNGFDSDGDSEGRDTDDEENN